MRLRAYLLWLAVVFLASPGLVAAQDPSFGITLPPSLNFATSPSPVGSGARAAGKSFAFIAIADDATAASHNPAGLVQLERPEVSIMGSYYARLERQDVTRPAIMVEGQELDRFDLNYLSVVYPFEVLKRTVVVSLNVQRLFDLEGATDVVSRFNRIDGIQRVSARQEGGLFAISPAVAVQVTPAFSLGAAFNIWPDLFGNGWEQRVTVTSEGFVQPSNSLVPFDSQGHIREDFAFRGFNVTAGFLWTINPIFSLGGVFRSPFTARVTRSHTSSLTFTLRDGSEPFTPPPNRFQETLDMEMPLAYGLGVAARLSDRLTLSMDVSRIHWSDFRLEESTRDDAILVENGAPSGKGRAVLQGEADDTTSVRLGAEYLWLRPKLLTSWFGGRRVIVPLRTGFFYNPEPGAGRPDTFVGFSFGTGLTVGQFLFDMAYTFRTGTVEGEATDTAVYQHGVVASVIYHF